MSKPKSKTEAEHELNRILPHSCPYCHGDRLTKHGVKDGEVHYTCKVCKQEFSVYVGYKQSPDAPERRDQLAYGVEDLISFLEG